MRLTMLFTCLAVLTLGSLPANAGIVADFVQPPFFGQSQTTYQEWFHFPPPIPVPLVVSATNAPAAFSNSNGTPNAFDSTAATDGAFLTGSNNIYSPGGITHPTITVPNFGLGSAWVTQIVLQTETLGNVIDLSSVTITPAGGSPVTVLAPDTTLLVHVDLGGQGFRDDYQFIWNLPGNASSYTLAFSANATSMSWQGARVDTLASPAAAPEPAALGILGGGGLLLLRRRRRTC